MYACVCVCVFVYSKRCKNNQIYEKEMKFIISSEFMMCQILWQRAQHVTLRERHATFSIRHDGAVAAGLSRAPIINRTAPFCPRQWAVCVPLTKVKVVLRPPLLPHCVAILSHWPCVADCHGRRLTSMSFAIFLMKTWRSEWAIAHMSV